jgi:hypothetical protein
MVVYCWICSGIIVHNWFLKWVSCIFRMKGNTKFVLGLGYDVEWKQESVNTLLNEVEVFWSQMKTFQRFPNWIPILKVGSIKMSQIVGARFGTQNKCWVIICLYNNLWLK